jgi:hypothetical protein
MNKAISKYMAEIGRIGGRAGKGSEARREAALKANRARWKDHVKQCEAVKHKTCQSEGNGENKVK